MKIVFRKINIPLYETEALAEYFSDMSAKGLFVCRLVANGAFTFFKTVPQRITYCVDLFKPNENQKVDEYLELCAASGWYLVCCDYKNGIYVFHTVAEHPTQLHTDPAIEAECTRKVSKKLIRNSVLLFFLPLIYMINPLLYFFTIPQLFYEKSYLSIIMFMFLICLIPLGILNLKRYFLIKRKMKSPNTIPAKKTSYKNIIRTSRTFGCIFLVIFLTAVVFITAEFISISAGFKISNSIPSYATGFTLESLKADSTPVTEFYDNHTGMYFHRNYELKQNWDTDDAAQLDLHCYSCNFTVVAKDLYNRIERTKFAYYNAKWTNLGQNDCDSLGISEGKYSCNEKDRTLYLILRNKKDVYEIQLLGFSSFDENIKSVIRNAMAKQ